MVIGIYHRLQKSFLGKDLDARTDARAQVREALLAVLPPLHCHCPSMADLVRNLLRKKLKHLIRPLRKLTGRRPRNLWHPPPNLPILKRP